MAITAGMVKDLRERTGAGMMDCKKALEEAQGDMDRAIDVLREKGLSKAAKKAGRIAAEGMVATYTLDATTAAIVEVNSETDFVAKNEKFQTYVATVAKQACATKATDIDSFLAEASVSNPEATVTDELNSQIAVIGENLKIRRFEKVVAQNGIVASYIHMGGKIGVLVELTTDVVNDNIVECGKNVAMQIAAIAPLHVDQSEIPEAYKIAETAILKQQAINENPDKPENIIDKMIVGRLNKQMKEICLLDQSYVKDSDMTVKQYVDSVAKAEGAQVSVVRFVRFETGEGIEKKVDNFAEEVAKQING